MKKLLNLKSIVGLIIIIVALLPDLSTPEPSLLNIERPTVRVIELVTPISDIVLDPTDRAKLAIFNYSFTQRLKNYDVDTQQLNDIYVLAASKFFKDSLVDKYRNLDKLLVSLLEQVTGSDNHKLTEQEKTLLVENFSGLSWSLIQKR